MRVFKGSIVRLIDLPNTGFSVLDIDDWRRGRMSIPCVNPATIRGLDSAFPGLIRGDKYDEDRLAGEVIFYSETDLGIFAAFSPADRTAPEIVEWYEAGEHAPGIAAS